MADSMTDELIQADEAFAGNSLLATFSSEARGLIERVVGHQRVRSDDRGSDGWCVYGHHGALPAGAS